jgi:3-hydroxyisobutyrate dehydrogenase-like beta-hydroxyacid dehydrogenase
MAVNYNLLRALQTLGASIALVERGGVDASEFIDILTASAYTGTVHQGYGSRIVQRRYTPAGFTPSNALKHLDLAIDAF